MTGTRNAAGSGSYVLHAMDPGERRDFEDDLIESEELRSEVTELTDTAVLLGLAVPAIQPAPSLKAGIMARIATLPQLAAEPDEPEPLAAVLPFAPRLVTPDEHWYNRPVALVVSAAAAVVLIVGAVVGTGLVVNTVTSNQQAAALAAISAAPDARQAEASVSTGGTATLVWSDQLGRSAFVGSGLKSLPSNETYELWYIDKAGKAMAAGLFDVTGDRTVSVLVGTLHKGDTVGVTVEPAGGSTQPTTKPIVAIAST